MKYTAEHTFGLDEYGTVYDWEDDEICQLYFEGEEDTLPSHRLIIKLDQTDLEQLLRTIMYALANAPLGNKLQELINTIMVGVKAECDES